MHDGPYLEPLVEMWVTVMFAPFILWALDRLIKTITERRPKKGRARTFRLIALAAFLIAQVSFVAYTWISCNHEQFDRTATVTCSSNLRRLSMDMEQYLDDNDKTYPPASNWGDGIAPYRGTYTRDIYHCMAGSTPYSYAMNDQLSALLKKKTKEPDRTVLLFEHDAQNRNGHGGPSDVTAPRHENILNFAFADGHVKYLSTSAAQTLHWHP